VEPAEVDPERPHTSGAKRAHALISGGRRLERARCTRARPLFREPGSV